MKKINPWCKITKFFISNIPFYSRWYFITRFFIATCSKKQILNIIDEFGCYSTNKNFLKEINRKYLSDIDIAISAINKSTLYFSYLSEKLRNDKAIVKLYLKNSCQKLFISDFSYFGADILNDSDIAMILIEKAGVHFKYFGAEVRNNKHLFLYALKLCKEDYLKNEPYLPYYIGNTLKLDKEVLLEVVNYYQKVPLNYYDLNYDELINEAKNNLLIALFAPAHFQKRDTLSDIIINHLKEFDPKTRSIFDRKGADVDGINEDENRLKALCVLLDDFIAQNIDAQNEINRIKGEITEFKRVVEA
jgi:hypothetical protein